MNNKLFTSVTKYLEEGLISKDKDTKKDQVQW